MRISKEDVKTAYRKLKYHVYHDSFDLLLRGKIAEFECSKDFDSRLSKMTMEINKVLDGEGSKYFIDLIDAIDYYLFPKKLNSENKSPNIPPITDAAIKSKYGLDKVNFFIDAPIEVHLLSTLWVFKCGNRLNINKSQYSYAHKFDISDDFMTNIKLFRPYYKQYGKWRDNALKIVKQKLLEKNNIAVLTLDIKSFYHSVRFPFNRLRKEIMSAGGGELMPLTDLIQRICEKYTRIVLKQKQHNPMLPIGILFSGILANWYLQELDKQINDRIQPVYYGRYVDDILIVHSLKSKKKYTLIDDFIKDIYIKKSIISSQSHAGQDKNYKIRGYDNLFVQESKIKLYLFSPNDSCAVLENFERNLRESSSEFRFLPEEDMISGDFNEKVYSLIYAGSVNKLGSVVGLATDKFSISKYLAKQIYFSRLVDMRIADKKKIVRQLHEFFSGGRIIEYYQLWEKVFTCLFLFDADTEHIKLCSKIGDVISKVHVEDGYIEGWASSELIIKLRRTLTEYLRFSIAMPFSLNSSAYRRIGQLRSFKKLGKVFYSQRVDRSILSNIRHANLFRHDCVFTPLLNYTVAIYNDECDLTDRNYRNVDELLPFEDKIIAFSPRHVNYDEAAMFSIRQSFNKIDIVDDFDKDFRAKFDNHLNRAFDAYFQINYKDKNIKAPDKLTTDIFFQNKQIKQEKLIFNSIKLNSSRSRPKMRIALANVVVNLNNVKASLNEKPNLSAGRINELFKILNMVEKERADLLVMPELSVPYDWLPILANFSRRKHKALVFGLEHFVTTNRYAINAIVTILPFKIGYYSYSFVKLRIKNHYSPEEELQITNQHKCKVPRGGPYTYDIFIWDGIHFSCFNCYELADIKHRAIFRSKLDIFFASEYNPDVNYFSNIVESVSRDIHCYFVQVNSADYGDSRITSPSKTEVKNIIQIKGGDNSTILVGEVDIQALREFQIKDFKGQSKDGSSKYWFKPTPPDFDKDEVRGRM